MPIKIKPCGGIIKELELIYFPLGSNIYAYNFKGKKEVTEALPIKEGKGKKERIAYWAICFGDENFIFDGRPLSSLPYECKITEEDIEKWKSSKQKQDISEIYSKIKETLKICFDLNDEIEYDVLTLFVLQSWFFELMDVVFYIDIKGRMGGGKTLLLEILKDLCRNGMLSNDISFAAIPRMIDKYKVVLFLDEIDSINPKEKYDIFKILRAGYKKNNPYIRLKPKTFEDESFDVYGPKAFNYRSDIAEDLKNRAISINPPKSEDKALPIISMYKQFILNPIYKQIWQFYMNSLDIVNKINEFNICKVNIEMYNNSTNKGGERKYLFLEIATFYRNLLTSLTKTNCLSDKNNQEVLDFYENLFKSISGRNIELFFIVISLCSFLGLDIYTIFKSVFEEKEEMDKYDEVDIKIALKEVLVDQYPTAREISGNIFHTHRQIAKEFNKKVYMEYGFRPTSHQLKRQLRELGFMDKVNRKVMKVDGKSMLCLIYDRRVKNMLDLTEKLEMPLSNDPIEPESQNQAKGEPNITEERLEEEEHEDDDIVDEDPNMLPEESEEDLEG